MRNENAVLKSAARTVALLKTLPDLRGGGRNQRSTMPSLVLAGVADPFSVRPVVFEKSVNDTVVAGADRAVRADSARTTAAIERIPRRCFGIVPPRRFTIPGEIARSVTRKYGPSAGQSWGNSGITQGLARAATSMALDESRRLAQDGPSPR
jgi:hypothetical protein